MPGTSWQGSLPPLAPHETALCGGLKNDVEFLAGTIGERNVSAYANLSAAAEFIEASLADGGFAVARQTYRVGGRNCHNLEAAVTGSDRADEIVVIGGHYDTVPGSPGANDNASGVAAVLALARAWAGKRPQRTLRFCAFVNEEPPYFQTEEMGSRVYAKRCRRRGEKIVAMLSLETIGYYSSEPSSQTYPFPFRLFYPSKGNFIGFVGNMRSRRLVRSLVASFRRHVRFPSEGVAAMAGLPGIGWSDHWAFWQEGYPAVMVTDTAPYRYSSYHQPSDTPDKLCYDCMARVVAGLDTVVADLTGAVIAL